MYDSSIIIKSITSMFDSVFPSLNIGYMFNIRRVIFNKITHYYRDEVLLILNIVYIELIRQRSEKPSTQ